MNDWQRAAVAAIGALLAGCGGTGARYPDYQTLNVAVSSGWGTGIDGDHEIPDSQVSIGGRSGGAAVGAGFGMMGLGFGSAIDSLRNASDLQGAADALRLKFNRIVAGELQKRARDGQPDYRITRRDAEETSMLLFPFARFVAGGEAKPQLTLYIEARFGERTKTSFSESREYAYVSGESRAILGAQGWSDGGGAAFKATTQRGFERLAHAVSDDIRGAYKGKREAAETTRVRWQMPAMKSAASGVVLAEYPDYVVMSPVFKDVVQQRVVVIERSLLQ